MRNATNHMSPNNIPSVTDQNSLMAFLKSQGLNYVIVKAATSNALFSVTGGNVPIGSPSAAFNKALVDAAHANGLKIFGSNRSWGGDIPGEIAVADYVFQQGADGFIYDAESEWEPSASRPWITNAPAQAWALCSAVRSNWPTKFIAHNPYDTLYLHSSFPYKEFGYWCDSVMPQVYHHSASQGNAIAAIHWTDVNYKKFQDSLYLLPPTNINGLTVYWTNAIKPLTLMRDVYNGGSGTPVHPDTDVRNFLDYLVADPNCVTEGGYKGSDYFRSELHSPGQWAHIRAATIGDFPGVVNNIIIDDAKGTRTGTWTHVKTIDATTGSTVSFTGEFGTDTDSFGTNYWKKTQGTGSSYMQFTPNIITAGDYDVYQWHPTRPDASSDVPFLISHAGGTTTVYANQQTNGGNWTLLGRFYFDQGDTGFIRVLDNFTDPNAVAMVDGLKMVFVTYSLDVNGNGGTVTKNPNEIRYVAGTPVTVTATPQTGYIFTGWSGGATGTSNPLQIVMDDNKTITANFSSTEIILDNTDAAVTYTGDWQAGTATLGKYGSDYRFAVVSASGSSNVVFRPNIAVAGRYNVYVWHTTGGNRSPNAPWTIAYDGASTNVLVNQQVNGAQWVLIASSLPFKTGTSGYAQLANNASPTVVMADAVRFLLVDDPTPPKFQSITHLEDGSLNLLLNGSVGTAYSIDRSTNLISWQEITNVVITNGVYQLIVPTTDQDQSFYRIRR